MAVIENLDIVLGARTEKLDAGLDRSRGKVRSFESDVDRIGKAAQASLAPIRQLGTGLLAAIPGASAAATAFSAITAAFAASTAAKVSRDTRETAVASAAAATSMATFATAAAASAVATAALKRNMSLPRLGSRGMTRYNPATAFAGALRGADSAIDAEFTVLSRSVPAQAGVARGAIASIGPAGIAAGAAVGAAFIAAGVGVAAAAVTIRGVREQLGEIDEIAKSAAKSNVTFKELAGFRLAVGESTGLGPEAADKALQKLQIRLSEAQRNGGALNDQLRAIGLDAGQLLEAGPLEAMKQLSTATQRMQKPSDQLMLAFRLFEEEGSALVNTLRAGPDAITDTVLAAESLGLTLSEAQAKQVEAANDAWGRVELIATGAFRQIAAEVAPLITVIAEQVSVVAEGFGGWEAVLPAIVDWTAIQLGQMVDMVELVTETVNGFDKLQRYDLTGALESFGDALDQSTPDEMLARLREIRAAAAEAAKTAAGGGIDVSAIQAEEEAAQAAADAANAKAEADERARQQSRDAINERLTGLRDEITALRQGADAAERMRLARQGADKGQLQQFDALAKQKRELEEMQELMERGKALREQFANTTPEQQLRAELNDLQQLLNVGAIDFGTFARAAREAAARIGDEAAQKQIKAADSPTFGALQRGSVAAYSAGLRNEQAGKQVDLQARANTLLEGVNAGIDRMAARLDQLQTIGRAG